MASRYELLQLLAPKITDELITLNVAGVRREWCSIKLRDGNWHHIYMSGATAFALGLAAALPHRRVISLDGDGSMLMGLSILPAIAQQNPSNLIVIVFDNEAYDACAQVPTFTAGPTDLAATARGAGIKRARLVREPSEFQAAIDEAFQAKEGTSFIVAKVDHGTVRVPFADIGGTESKFRFVRYIEQTEGIKILKSPAKKV